ncbi:glycosyltransferase [Vibrio sp. Vb0877]|uniref:glycosyltransferase family 2 protein n=1 Tax=Vibrio sp. Vb0877 TaxID=2816073 RepID=UPI001A8FC934|nr:glycosyltransferase [Vibrio sp. Vb0877]MBO0208189.1 glycosyltransferase [Vibrio sp. Vb0877]
MSKKYPLVSIAIITYNQKEYLRECIESCLVQDYPNFEIVIADDCSTDGTQDMLREYEAAYPSKFVLRLSEKNQGITPNSNECLQACSGEYIAMLGGDDLLLESKITKQVDVLISQPGISICGTYTRLIDSKGNNIGIRKDFKRKIEPFYELSELVESGNGLVPVVSYMFRASLIPEEGFEPRIPVASDSLFMCRVASLGKIYIIKEELTAYRIHDSHARKLGYKLDSILSHAFIEYYFPNCIPMVIKRKSLFYRTNSVGAFLNNDYKLGFTLIKASISYKLTLKSMMIYLLAKLRLFRFIYHIIK